jgi:hypothetical protein
MPRQAQPEIVVGVRSRLLRAIVVSALTLTGGVSARAGDVPIRIMTQNVYQGTNFDELFCGENGP